MTRGIATECAGGSAIRRATRAARAAAGGVAGIAFGQPVEARVGGDAHRGFAVFRAEALKENLRGRGSIMARHAPYFGRTRRMAHGTSARGALEQFAFGNG